MKRQQGQAGLFIPVQESAKKKLEELLHAANVAYGGGGGRAV